MESKENKTEFIIVRVTKHEKEMFLNDARNQSKSQSELARDKFGFSE